MPEGGIKYCAGKEVTLLVWDAEGPPPVGDWTTVLWRKYAGVGDPAVISITQQVDLEADELRRRYLAWIYDLGETRLNGRRAIDHLSLRPGFSYWWLSSLAQKFNVAEGSLINDAIKALAFERLVATRQANAVVLISGNRQLADCVEQFCSIRGLRYEFRPTKTIRAKGYLQSLYQSLPHSLRAFVYLGWYIWQAIPLWLQKKPAMPALVGEVLLIDVLVHLDPRAISNGSFVSNYWTALVEKLSEWQIKSNWLHGFFRHPAIPTLGLAQGQIERFTASSKGAQFHALVEGSFNFRAGASALRDYFTVRRSFARLQGIGCLRPAGSDLNLWPLHAGDWGDSLCGKGAMTNCLRMSLFEDAVNRFPTQRVGIYIAENQPWEMALVYAWRAAGHGTLIGTPHTTIRFWDLRYHYDARSYQCRTVCDLPLPDILAVNGPVAKESVLASGYNPDRIIEVEALRFLHLSNPPTGHQRNRSYRNEMRVLVCGDFLTETNERIISWLKIAATTLENDTAYIFKPHPAYPFSIIDYPMLKFEISEAPLADLLADCDVVFASNITSAAVDAYCSGVPVIQMLDGNSFNNSPLRGLEHVTYARDPKELAEALDSLKRRKYGPTTPYFNLDENLLRWRNLLDIKGTDRCQQEQSK